MRDTTRTSYEDALRSATAELAAHDKRGEALRDTVASLTALLALGATTPEAKPAARPVAKKARKARKAKKAPRVTKKRLRKPRRSAGAGHPAVGANHYKGMGPTAGYRSFIAEFGDSYTVPQIRDALVAGGVESKSSTSLLTGLHSVRRRDQVKAEAQKAAAKDSGAG